MRAMAGSRPPSPLWRLRGNLPARRISRARPVQRVRAWERPPKEPKEQLDPGGSAASTTDGVVGRPNASLVDHPSHDLRLRRLRLKSTKPIASATPAIRCAPDHRYLLPIGVKCHDRRRHMVRSTSQHRTEWALAVRRETQGQQLPAERELSKELPPELHRGDKEHDPYYDVVGTC